MLFAVCASFSRIWKDEEQGAGDGVMEVVVDGCDAEGGELVGLDPLVVDACGL